MSFDAIGRWRAWFYGTVPRVASPQTAVRPAGVVAPRRPLWTVQVLRGTAALMVVAGHAQSAVAGMMHAAHQGFARSTLVPWGAGVDLFFVISGFIIVHASRDLFGKPRAAGAFLRRRLARVAPLYWLVTTLLLALLAAASLKGGDPFPTARAIAASYAFIPFDSWSDGGLFPVFDLGWTLNYEMFFYVLFALVVGWPRRRALLAIGLLLLVLTAVGTGFTRPSTLWFWTRPIILDFGLGVAVAAMAAHGWRWPRPIRVAVAAAGAGVLLADPGNLFNGPVGVTVANAWPRVLFAGLPVAALLAAATAGPEPSMPRATLSLTRVGDASYSLYLLHPFVLIATEKLAQKGWTGHAPGWLLSWGMLLASIAVALAGYRWAERPLTRAAGRIRLSAAGTRAPLIAG